ncbi:hypothetical protein Bbelb_283490 [Branchiostoma belcheri]|nr:hypothetical protein Bbelb_283490 [Branchiostoma belcheri]
MFEDDSVYTYDPSADLFARWHDDSSMEGVTQSSTVGCPVADADMAEDSKQSTAMDLRTVIPETQVHGQVEQKSQKPRIRTSTRSAIRLRATMVDEWLNNEDEYKTCVPDINLQDEAPRFLLRDQFDGDLVFNFTFRTCLVCHTSNFTEFMYLQLRCQPKRCNDNIKSPYYKSREAATGGGGGTCGLYTEILEDKRAQIVTLDTWDRENKHTTARPTARSGHGGTTSNSKPTVPITSASVICYCSKCGSKYVSERTKLRSEEATPGSSGETSHFLEDEKDERNRPTFHVCKNDCVLYTGDLMGATECPKCKEMRFDDRGKAKKEYFYFPLLETVRTLYAVPKISSMLQEHGLTLSEDVPQVSRGETTTRELEQMEKSTGKNGLEELHRLPYYDPVSCRPVESMHAIQSIQLKPHFSNYAGFTAWKTRGRRGDRSGRRATDTTSSAKGMSTGRYFIGNISEFVAEGERVEGPGECPKHTGVHTRGRALSTLNLSHQPHQTRHVNGHDFSDALDKRLLTQLRCSMTEEKLNNCLLLHVHKYVVDSMDLGAIAADFALSR